jgi:hypothetical protein
VQQEPETIASDFTDLPPLRVVWKIGCFHGHLVS